MNEKPVNHGFDHRPGGTDPIPGIRLGAAAALYLTAGGGATISIPGGVIGGYAIPFPSSYISDPAVFSTDGTTLSLLQPGAYIIEGALEWADPSTSQGNISLPSFPSYGREGGIYPNSSSAGGLGGLKDVAVYMFQPIDIVGAGGSWPVSLSIDLTAATAKDVDRAFIRAAFIPCFLQP